MRKWFAILVCVLFLSSCAYAVEYEGTGGANSTQMVKIAVIPIVPEDAEECTEWTVVGTAFDVEKRLDRWAPIYSVLPVEGIYSTPCPDAKTAFEKLGADVVITVSGKCSGPDLSLTNTVWYSPDKPGMKFNIDGLVSEIFSYDTTFVDLLVRSLQLRYPGLPEKVAESARIHEAPAASVQAYEQIIKGIIAMRKGDAEAASIHLGNAISMNSGSWWVHYLNGFNELKMGRHPKALIHFTDAMMMDPDFYPEVHVGLYYAHLLGRETPQARLSAKRYKELTGKDIPVMEFPESPVN